MEQAVGGKMKSTADKAKIWQVISTSSLDKLPLDDQIIMRLYYSPRINLDEPHIAQWLKISKQAVNQRRHNALDSLKCYLL